MTYASDAAEPTHLTAELPWLDQVKLHMRAHNSAPLALCQKRRLRMAEAAGTDPWEAFEQIIGADHVRF